MSSNNFFRKIRKIKNINIFSIKATKKNFQILTPEECFVNMKESLRRLNVESCSLKPLPEASNLIYNIQTMTLVTQDAVSTQCLTGKSTGLCL